MRSGRSFISFRKPFGIVSNFETELARVAHRYTLEVEGIKRNMTWARIFNLGTVQFSKKSPEKRKCQGPGKRGHIVADTLLPMMFLGLRKLGNICCGHNMILKKIRNNFCTRTKKICVRNKCYTRGQTGKHLCR